MRYGHQTAEAHGTGDGSMPEMAKPTVSFCGAMASSPGNGKKNLNDAAEEDG